jgi:predicted metal-dependent hydrolase
VIQTDGRAKAYRPLPEEERRRALAAGLDAYERGDYFLAHEILEPAWMGTDDIGEREVLQGLIKLAAAFVHAARGNPAGVAKNLRGARERLATPAAKAMGADLGIDAAVLEHLIAERLEELEREPDSGGKRPAKARPSARRPRAVRAIAIPRSHA